MSNTAQWAAIVGSLLPPLVAWLQSQKWNSEIQAAMFLIACLGAATATNYIDKGGWTWHNWLTDALIIVGTALGTYHGLWKPAGVIGKARAAGPVK